MNAAVPTALAVAGTALMAVAIFGPFRRPLPEVATASPAAAPPAPPWPALVDASAIACDANARIDLAEALGALGSRWSASVLRQAHASEADPVVRAAIADALSSTQSLVT